MFKDKFKNIKSIIIKKTDGNNKKNIENLVVFLVLLIITGAVELGNFTLCSNNKFKRVLICLLMT